MLRQLLIVMMFFALGLWVVIGKTNTTKEWAFEDCVFLYQEQRFDEALDAFKSYVNAKPTAAEGHLYLAILYQREDPWLYQSIGEADTALRLFHQSGTQMAFDTDEYFELRCYLEKIKTYISRIDLLQITFRHSAALKEINQECWNIYDLIDLKFPDNPDVRWVHERLRERGLTRPAPSEQTEPQELETEQMYSV